MKRPACHAEHTETCPLCLLFARSAEYQAHVAGASLCVVRKKPATRVVSTVVREDRCIYLGVRLEEKQGCRSGIGCLHDCDQNLPAVPNKYCQMCPSYAGHTRVNPINPVPWVGDWLDFAVTDVVDPALDDQATLATEGLVVLPALLSERPVRPGDEALRSIDREDKACGNGESPTDKEKTDGSGDVSHVLSYTSGPSDDLDNSVNSVPSSCSRSTAVEEPCSYRSPQTYPASRFPGKRGRVPLDTIYYQCRKLRTFVSPSEVGNKHCGVACQHYTTTKHQHNRPLNRRAAERSQADMLMQCTNRGPLTNDTVACSTCPGRTELKLYGCQKHGACTIAKKGDDENIACCATCKDFTLAPPEENSSKVDTGPADGRTFKWAYGLTTIRKRAETTLPKTLASLRAAGFEKPHLFVDGDYDGKWWRTMFGLDVTCRYPRVRTFGNWVLSLAELYILNPNADRYAIFQDDFITYPNLREYLERTRYPHDGYLNLYSFPVNERLSNGHIGFYPADQTGQGAVALVFSHAAVRALINCQYMVDRPLDAARGWRAVDGGIVTAMKRQGWREYVHNPSLVQHIGVVSSMGNGRHQTSRTFKGEKFNALDLLTTT